MSEEDREVRSALDLPADPLLRTALYYYMLLTYDVMTMGHDQLDPTL